MISRAVWLVSHTTQSGSHHDAAEAGATRCHVSARASVRARVRVPARALVRGELGYRLHEQRVLGGVHPRLESACAVRRMLRGAC